MSRTQLYRKIKALTGDSAVAFIQKVRLEAALSLMKNNKQLSLSEIAYQTGFSSPSYFSTLFKRVYGKSPSEVTVCPQATWLQGPILFVFCVVIKIFILKKSILKNFRIFQAAF